MKASKKRGFTIIELVIVIAVVAILAAVLIPVFSNLVEQAKEANDTALVRNLNTAAKLGNKHYDTMYDVLKAVDEEGGYNVSKINAQSKSEILWDMENQCFVMLKDGEEVKSENKYNYWKIYNKGEVIPAAADQTYSVYVADDKLKKLPTGGMSVGVDLGNNEVINSVSYKNTGDAKSGVVIRTNTWETTATVNAANDNVKHYGIAGKVTVTAVAENSYHEFGETKAIVVKSGRVVVEKDGVVNTVVAAPASGSTVKVEVTTSDTIVYAPDSVEVKGTTSSGALSSTTEINNAVTAAKYFAGGLGTEANPYLIATAENAMNIYDSKASGYFKLINNITVSDEIYMSGKSYTIDLNGHSITLDYAEGVKPNNGSVLYIGGKNSKLTINDSSADHKGAIYGSTKDYSNKVTSAVRVGNYGKLEINGGNFYGRSTATSCIFVMTSSTSGSKATVTINGGYFQTTKDSSGKYYVLNHQDNATTGCTITVSGGTFRGYNPGVTVVDPVNAKTGKITLAAGCTTTEKTEGNYTYYTVTKTAE